MNFTKSIQLNNNCEIIEVSRIKHEFGYDIYVSPIKTLFDSGVENFFKYIIQDYYDFQIINNTLIINGVYEFLINISENKGIYLMCGDEEVYLVSNNLVSKNASLNLYNILKMIHVTIKKMVINDSINDKLRDIKEKYIQNFTDDISFTHNDQFGDSILYYIYTESNSFRLKIIVDDIHLIIDDVELLHPEGEIYYNGNEIMDLDFMMLYLKKQINFLKKLKKIFVI